MYFFLPRYIEYASPCKIEPPPTSPPLPCPPPPPTLTSPLLWPSRLWSSANIVATKAYGQERPASHHGVRCSRCKVGPIAGSCYRCAAGCVANAKRPSSKRFSSKQSSEGGRLPGLETGAGGGRSSQSSGRSRFPGGGRGGGETARSSSRAARAVMHTGGGDEGCYTLCEACFSERGRFHPPHPFARLRPGFGDSRLSCPELYEAV